MSFKDITSIGCGGKIKYLYLPNSIESLAKVFKMLNEENYLYEIVGNGTNILASDEDYDGVVINTKSLAYSYEIYSDTLVCNAFYPSKKLAYELGKLNIGDLSFLAGIPGLVGGAVKQNSGAYGEEVKDYLLEIKYIDHQGNIRVKTKDEMLFDYRYSIFKDISGIIIEATFKIRQNIETMSKIKERLKKRKETQPINSKNMGSIFKNPGICKAWEIIDKLGLRGTRINDAAVSIKHANFIINLGDAKSQDVLDLIKIIQRRSEKELGVVLECEINLINWKSIDFNVK